MTAGMFFRGRDCDCRCVYGEDDGGGGIRGSARTQTEIGLFKYYRMTSERYKTSVDTGVRGPPTRSIHLWLEQITLGRPAGESWDELVAESWLVARLNVFVYFVQAF